MRKTKFLEESQNTRMLPFEEDQAPLSRTNRNSERNEEYEDGDPNSLQLYLREIRKTPLLSVDEEVELAEKIKQGDEQARALMIQANLRLVVKIAYDYNHFGLPLMDLISEGNIGLVKAVERFDPSKGGKLSTYAAWWIKQSIKRALANQGKTIRLPVHMIDKISKMRRKISAMTEELGREPTDDELSLEMGIPVNKVAHYKSVSVRPSSLDAPVGDEDSTELGELVRDEKAVTPFESLKTKTTYQDLADLLSRLEPREEEIVRLRFGLDGEAPMTLEEVGEMFNITRERVRQLQNIALNKLRKTLTSRERQRSKEEVVQENIERKRREVLNEYFSALISNSTDN
jgi:RNA polymerase primary sigma factor